MKKLIFLFMVYVTLHTHTTYAYESTGHHDFLLKNDSHLYVVDFSFGHEKHTIQIPAVTERSTVPVTDKITYEIVDASGKQIDGRATGIVASTASLNTNVQYATQKGLNSPFRLIVLFTPSTHVKKPYHVVVTGLPFMFDNTQHLNLNPSELQYYSTDLK